MSVFARRFWFIAPLAALAFLFLIHRTRVQRVEVVSASPSADVTVDPKSPTGYANGFRMLIVPGHNNESYQWIAQAQKSVADGTWRLRHVDYDNAPTGRPVHTPSPYRWWLATVGWVTHLFSDQPIGQAIEQGALWADPVLQFLLVAGAAVFVWRRFGPVAAMVSSLGLAAMFPLAAAFVPGVPDARTLAHVTLFASVLLLLAGIFAIERSAAKARRWFIVAGAIGGVATWLSVNATIVMMAVALGAAAAHALDRGKVRLLLPWRAWGIAGAVGIVVAWLLEYAPAHLDLWSLRLEQIHPLYALPWLGAGELLARLQSRRSGSNPSKLGYLAGAAAALAVVSVPLTMWAKGNVGFFAADIFAQRLTLLDDIPGADNTAKWIVESGSATAILAMALPLLLLIIAGWLIFRRSTPMAVRIALTMLSVPACLVFLLACAELSWWTTLGFLLLAVAIAATAGITISERAAARWLIGAAIVAIPGALTLWPATFDPKNPALTQAELQGIAERDFAQWLARRQGSEGGVVLAPPNLTVSLFYHGGLKGLGSPYRENEEGFRASVRLAGAIHADESHALARQRNLTHIVMPSWDDFLDEYARLGGAELSQTFVGLLRSWLPPRWLKPVPYYLPNIPEFANDQVFIFEHTDIQDNATSLGRLAEYFVDMGQIELASQVARALAQEYGADLGAQIARARTEIVRRDRAAFEKVLATITRALQERADDALLWDRRVSLCLVLATANRLDLAEAQAQRCLDEMGEFELRGLSEPTLFQFLLLCKARGLEISDPELKELARSLVPAALRHQL